ncbi:MAG: efflux RND transporter permease subunit [Spirochaetia bacterium]|nr:efflux RND transporter permease subunit [Spirochaetia bacterium]
MSRRAWLARPVAACSLVLAACAIALLILSRADYGSREASSKAAMVVTVRHHGVDARDMERSIAIPLEDAFAAIPDVVETSTSSEYGKVRATVAFAPDKDADEASLALRDAVWRVYERLPSSVQRPEIGSSSEGRGPVWIAALSSRNYKAASLGRIIEQLVKPALEKLPGVGDIELAGIGMPELVVEIDESMALGVGIGMAEVVHAMARNDTVLACGAIKEGANLTSMVADGRFTTPESLQGLLVASGTAEPIRLGSFARISLRDRKPEALSRVDGEGVVTIAVSPGGRANLAALSRDLARETSKLAETYELDFTILHDAGIEISRSFRSTLFAALQGAVAVAIASALLLGSGRLVANKINQGRSRNARHARLVAAAAVPFILLVSAASVSSLGYSLDKHVLAGLAIGLGASVDAVILVTERLGAVSSIQEGGQAMASVIPSLASGSATTIVVLIPLGMLDFLSEGVARVAMAMAAVCICSCMVTLLVIPPLILRGSCPVSLAETLHTQYVKPKKIVSPRMVRRALARQAIFCARRPLVSILAALALSLLGVLAIAFSHLDFGPDVDESSVFARVEFESGMAMDSVDDSLASGLSGLGSYDGCVQTTARRGSASLFVTFDQKKTNKNRVSECIRSLKIPGGFVWLPSPSSSERFWELVVSGDDDELCRSLAEDVASIVSGLPMVIDSVLNFKDGPEDMIFYPDRDRSLALGLGLDRVALALRRSVYGPVAYKRIDGHGETDVRLSVLREGEPSLRDALSTLVQTDDGSVRLDAFMRMSKARETARIQRRNRRRVAAITVRTVPIDTEKARLSIESSLATMTIPPGYTIEFDKGALEAASRLKGIAGSFIMAAALVYMACATASESFGSPLAIMSALLPSLAIPAILLAIARIPLSPSMACAFVAVSGVVVNASVLTVEACRMHLASGSPSVEHALYRAMKSRLGTLVATSGTSIAGALPFLLLSGSGNAMVRSLAFVTATGTAASFIVALTVVPALASLAPGLFRGFVLSDTHQRKEA